MAETVKKYLDQTGLAYFIDKLVNRQVKGKGLSTNDLTDALLAKLNATATSEGLSQLTQDVNALKALIEADSDSTINKFNEIVTFLEGIQNTDTLSGLLGDISTQIAAKANAADIPTALPNPQYLSISLNGNNAASYNGAEQKRIDITPSAIGAVASSQLKSATFAAGAFTAKTYSPTTAATINVPTKTSHLTNDSSFLAASDIAAITSAEIDSLISVA